jgi:sortase A
MNREPNPQSTGEGQAEAPSGRLRRSHVRRRPRRYSRWAVTLLGVVLFWSALGFIGYASGWNAHKRHAQDALIRSEHQAMDRIAQGHASGPCIQTSIKPGQLAGLLKVPSINLTAPVEEGIDDPELNVSVGHVPASVWPGVGGAAVFLAHDVSYFVHLNSLKAGDVVTYQTACNTVNFTVSGLEVVQAGSPVLTTVGPTIVLDTCYPPNALFFTSKRLLVRGTMTSSSATGTRSLGKGAAGVAQPSGATSFTVPAPTALASQGLTLEQNEAPMGTMTLGGQPSQAWEQSPGPLALEAAALEAYFGGLHSGAQQRTDWWAALAPGVAMPSQLVGARITGHNAPLDVEIDSVKGVASQVILRTTVTLAGGRYPGVYHETVATVVHGAVVTIGSWQFTPA